VYLKFETDEGRGGKVDSPVNCPWGEENLPVTGKREIKYEVCPLAERKISGGGR